MSVVLQVGQAGNAIGNELWQVLKAEADKRPEHPTDLFAQVDGGEAGSRRTLMARVVAVDTEPKAIQPLLEQKCIAADAAVLAGDMGGRGSNWAFGYGHGISADTVVSEAMEGLRRQVEAVDFYQGVLLLHSLGGGTGSGLGCRLLEELRDRYPLNYLTACPVAPFAHGEQPQPAPCAR